MFAAAFAFAQPVKLNEALSTAPDLALKKQTLESGHWGNYAKESAVDGTTTGAFWGCENIPVWLTVDLGKEAEFNTVRFVPFWGADKRYYQYHIEVSSDNAQWRRVVDETANTKPGTAWGRLFVFDPVKARYVRTTFTKNSRGNGTGGHIIEIEVRDLPPEAIKKAQAALVELEKPTKVDACLADPHQRLTQDAAPAPWAVTRVAARNSHVSMQLYLRSNKPTCWVLGGGCARLVDESADVMRVVVNDFVGNEGRIPADAVQPRFVGWIPLNGKPIAEPLLDADYLASDAGKVQPLWLTVHVPKDAAPGLYTGTIRIRAESGNQVNGEIAVLHPKLLVMPFDMPDGPNLSFNLDLWQHSSILARTHGVRRWSEEHWAVIDRYAADLASRGQKSVMVCIGETPWNGQGCANWPEYPSDIYEYSAIRGNVFAPTAGTAWPALRPAVPAGLGGKNTVVGADGKVQFDFNVFDRYVETYMKRGVNRWIECYGRRVYQHDPTTGETKPVSEQDQERFWREFTAHLKEKGWLAKTQIGFDEPGDHEGFLKYVRWLRGIAPGLRIKVACNSVDFARQTINEIDDVCFFWGVAVANRTEVKKVVADYHKRGGEVTWYLCCGPAKPNTFLTSPLIEARLIPWLNEELGLDGYLRWAHHCFPADPWHRPQWRWTAGDMFLVYPGANGAPVSSVRWEMMREGIEDYECLHRLRALAEKAQGAEKDALEKARLDALASVVNDPNNALDYTLDGARIESARRAVLEALAQQK